MKKIIEKELCYGCSACEKKCPQKCIEMHTDENGFLYPQIDEKNCIDCFICQKVCIRKQNQNIEKNKTNGCYLGVHKDENIWINSSSGGAFTAIVQSFAEKNPIIFGAYFDENMKVKHGYLKISETAKMRKSKYVQSELGNTFRDVERFLKDGRYVIFSGTPCQIAGLYAAIGKNHENLFTIDLICTGVCSPKLWKKYIIFLENHFHKKIKNVDMRYKVKNNNDWNIGDTNVVFFDGTYARNEKTRLYRYLYGQKTGYRDACYHCQFANTQRVADITIGDWWGSIDKLPEIQEHKGISVLLINSEKGNNIIYKLKKYMFLTEISLSEASAYNPTLSHATKYTKRNKRFWLDFHRMKTEPFFRKYSRPEIKTYIIWRFSKLIPKNLRSYIKRIVKI